MPRPDVIRAGPDLDMAVEVSGHGRAILLLHGFPGSRHGWEPVRRQLDRDLRVIAPDLLGFGESSKPADVTELSAERQAEAIATVLSQLAVTEVVLVGHDFGGPVGLWLMRDHPGLVSHLVLSATNAFPDTAIPFPLVAVTWPLVGDLFARVLFSRPSLAGIGGRAQGSPRVELDVARYVGDADQVRSIRLVFSGVLRELATRYAPLTRLLPTINVPTLVAWGDRDPFFSVDHGRRTAAAIPGALFTLYPGAGHFVPEERSRELAEGISDLHAPSP